MAKEVSMCTVNIHICGYGPKNGYKPFYILLLPLL